MNQPHYGMEPGPAGSVAVAGTCRTAPLRRRPRLVQAGSTLLVATLFLAACSSSSANKSSSHGDTLTFGMRYAPGTLDPAKSPYDLLQPIAYDPLLKRQPGGKIAAGLATSWGFVGTGNNVFQLTLRHGVTFSDGTPLNAAAVKTWFEYVPKAGGSAGSNLKIASIETPDQWTVKLNLSQPNPNVPSLLTGNGIWGEVASPKVVSSSPDQLSTTTDGTGPYMLDAGQSVNGDHYTYVPNPHYYDASRRHWKKIQVRIITDPSTMMQAMQTGQLQGGFASYSTLATAKSKGWQIFSPHAYQQDFLIIDRSGKNTKALGDVRVRQALNYAVDRTTIAKALYGDNAEPSSEIATSDAFQQALVNAYPYDPAKAKSLLAAGGYPNGFDMSVVSEDLGGPDFTQGTQAVVADWEKIGIKVKVINAKDLNTYFKSIAAGPAITQGPTTFFNSTLQMYNSNYSANSIYNPLKESDPRLDEMITGALAKSDPTQNWKDIVKYITDQAYWVPLAVQPTPTYAVKGIGNAQVTDAQYYPILADWTP